MKTIFIFVCHGDGGLFFHIMNFKGNSPSVYMYIISVPLLLIIYGYVFVILLYKVIFLLFFMNKQDPLR